MRGDFDKQLDLHKKLCLQVKASRPYFFYISTANVFDQDMSVAHTESDAPSAASEYGKFKMACEDLVNDHLDHVAIVRLPMVFGQSCRRVKELVESASKEEALPIFPGLKLNITTNEMIADKINHMVATRPTGIFHFGTTDRVHHASLYKELVDKLNIEEVNLVEETDLVGDFSLISERLDVFPADLQVTTDQVVAQLVEMNRESHGRNS